MLLQQQQLQPAVAAQQSAETADSLQLTGCWGKLQLRPTAEDKQTEMLLEEMAAAHQELKIGKEPEDIWIKNTFEMLEKR